LALALNQIALSTQAIVFEEVRKHISRIGGYEEHSIGNNGFAMNSNLLLQSNH
jgi:hypothetical protein